MAGQVTSSATWLVYPGWQHAYSSWHHSPSVVNCPSDVYSVSYDHFENAIFCRALVNMLPLPSFLKPKVQPTNTYYWPNEVRGYANGSASRYWSASKNGGCDSFLRFGRRYGSSSGLR